MKGLKQEIKIKLQRLKSLEEKEYNYETLNIYVESYNKFLANLNLTKPIKKLLDSSIGSISGSGPTAPERTEFDKLINLYTELLTEIDPNEQKTILGELRETSWNFKKLLGGINLALLLSCAWLFYNLGKDVRSNPSSEFQIVSDSTLLATIKILEHQKDSLKVEINTLRQIAYPTNIVVSYLEPETIDGGKIMIVAKDVFGKSKLKFTGNNIRISKSEDNFENQNLEYQYKKVTDFI